MSNTTAATYSMPYTEQTSSALLLERYKKIRQQSLDICSPLAVEDYVVQPVAEVSPPKWHLAHTSWFFEELILRKYSRDHARFNDGYPLLFNSYYKAAGKHWLQGERGNLSRPTVAEIFSYREHVDNAMFELLSADCNEAELFRILEIGLQHEQQHQELLFMDIKYILGANPELPVYSKTVLPLATRVSESWRGFEAGIEEIGIQGNGFYFDNEAPRHKVYAHPFAIRNSLVSNAEYLEFMTDGGYHKPNFWLSLGWDWVQQQTVSHPLYWFQQDGQWFEFTLHGVRPLDLNAPLAHVSYFEANAFANWCGDRLPAEHEMELFLRDDKLPEQSPGERLFHPLHAGQRSNQLWCWTQSHYSPYPGYQPFPGMLEEYNGKFMCNQFVLRGGCIATPVDHYRPSYRNFYQPQQQWMFSGVRLARDE